jgi:hypothetical protein
MEDRPRTEGQLQTVKKAQEEEEEEVVILT